MKGIVVTSHGPMAQGILESSKLFFGEQPQFKAFCLHAEDNPDDFVETLRQGIADVDTGDGVIVFCDILFGSPCNCMARIVGADLDNEKIQVVTGVNLGMVLQVLSTREFDDVDLEAVIDAGNQGIADLKAILKANL